MRHLRRRTGAARPRPHTVYVKSLYRIAGQDNYCRHHVIRVAVAAGAITEIKPGAGSGAVVSPRE